MNSFIEWQMLLDIHESDLDFNKYIRYMASDSI